MLTFWQRHHEKTDLFNLEDEELTHFGQSLGDIKHFDDPLLSDDEKDGTFWTSWTSLEIVCPRFYEFKIKYRENNKTVQPRSWLHNYQSQYF